MRPLIWAHLETKCGCKRKMRIRLAPYIWILLHPTLKAKVLNENDPPSIQEIHRISRRFDFIRRTGKYTYLYKESD
jgi:hypothetical protein